MKMLYFPQNFSNIFSVILVFMQLSRSLAARFCYAITCNSSGLSIKTPSQVHFWLVKFI